MSGNFPFSRVKQERVSFIAVNLNDSQDRFTLDAPTEKIAKVVLLEKLGYMIDPRELRGYLRGTVMVLINLDTKQDLVLESKTIDDALDEVLKAAHWEVREPIVSVDSHLS